MSDRATFQDPEFRAAFQTREQQQRVNTGKVASALVAVLMPAGIVLDKVMITSHASREFFLFLRLACSVLGILLWFLHGTPFGKRHYKLLGLPIALLPAF